VGPWRRLSRDRPRRPPPPANLRSRPPSRDSKGHRGVRPPCWPARPLPGSSSQSCSFYLFFLLFFREVIVFFLVFFSSFSALLAPKTLVCPPITPAGKKRKSLSSTPDSVKRKLEDDEDDSDDEEGLELTLIKELPVKKRQFLRAAYDALFPYETYPKSSDVTAIQGSVKFMSAHGKYVSGWKTSPPFDLSSWLDGRIRNHTGLIPILFFFSTSANFLPFHRSHCTSLGQNQQKEEEDQGHQGGQGKWPRTRPECCSILEDP